MNTHEAQLKIFETIHGMLTDLALEDDLEDTSRAETEEMMADVTEMLLDSLHFKVVSVEGDTIIAQLRPGATDDTDT